MDEYKPNRWRKRPIVITAQRMSEPFVTRTMEGDLAGKAGDWLITGVLGDAPVKVTAPKARKKWKFG